MESRGRWTRYVACMGRRRMHIGFWWGTYKEGDHQKDLDVDERIILRWILQK
jgi:hypothetical protein